jgi:hypothetical protein
MARKVQVILSDDLDDSISADETVTFALDGVQYEIDLSTKNANKLREVFAPFVNAGTKLGRGGGTASRSREGRGRSSGRSNRDQNRAIREWAQANGIEVSERGRIKREIVERFNAEAGR